VVLVLYQYSAIRIGLSIPSVEVIIIFTVALLGGELAGCCFASLIPVKTEIIGHGARTSRIAPFD